MANQFSASAPWPRVLPCPFHPKVGPTFENDSLRLRAVVYCAVCLREGRPNRLVVTGHDAHSIVPSWNEQALKFSAIVVTDAANEVRLWEGA